MFCLQSRIFLRTLRKRREKEKKRKYWLRHGEIVVSSLPNLTCTTCQNGNMHNGVAVNNRSMSLCSRNPILHGPFVFAYVGKHACGYQEINIHRHYVNRLQWLSHHA